MMSSSFRPLAMMIGLALVSTYSFWRMRKPSAIVSIAHPH